MLKNNRSLRVAFIAGEFPDPLGALMLNQAIGLIDQGVDVQIFSLLKPKNNNPNLDLGKYNLMNRVHYINAPRNKVPRFLIGLFLILKWIFINPIKILKSLNFFKYGKVALTLYPLYFAEYFMKHMKSYDIIHCHFGQRGLYGSVLKDIGIHGKLVTSFYGGDLSYFVQDTNKEVYLPLFDSGDLFIALSEDFKKKLIELGCPSSKIKVIRVMADSERFKIKTRKTLKDKITILTAARLVEKKGISYSIKAVHELHKKYPYVDYIIAGDGPLRNDIINQIKKLGAENYIKLLTNEIGADRIKKLFSNSDIFVLMSNTSSDGDTEGTPMVLMEAQLAELPVISTYHAGIPEIVNDGVTGFLVAERDVTALKNKLDILVKNEELRKSMGYNGRKFIKGKHGKNEVIKQLYESYKKLTKM